LPLPVGENGGGRGGKKGEKGRRKRKRGARGGRFLFQDSIRRTVENIVCDKYLRIYLEKGKVS
jgi:hypothetical protein